MKSLAIVGGVLTALPLLAGCYAYVPIMTPEPAPGTKVSLVLSDQGRFEAARQVGPYAVRLEGALVQATAADYVLQVSDVIDVHGARNKWMGETVPLRRSYVASTYERRFSRSRTLMLAAGLASAFVGFVVSRQLFGLGGVTQPGDPPPPDPNDQ